MYTHVLEWLSYNLKFLGSMYGIHASESSNPPNLSPYKYFQFLYAN